MTDRSDFAFEVFALRLRELRVKKGVTQTALGLAIGLKPQAINDMEHCRNYPSFKTLVFLADYFKVSADYLMGRSGDPTWVDVIPPEMRIQN
jgi:transcriptional regulator with XRE-family HTH domain